MNSQPEFQNSGDPTIQGSWLGRFWDNRIRKPIERAWDNATDTKFHHDVNVDVDIDHKVDVSHRVDITGKIDVDLRIDSKDFIRAANQVAESIREIDIWRSPMAAAQEAQSRADELQRLCGELSEIVSGSVDDSDDTYILRMKFMNPHSKFEPQTILEDSTVYPAGYATKKTSTLSFGAETYAFKLNPSESLREALRNQRYETLIAGFNSRGDSNPVRRFEISQTLEDERVSAIPTVTQDVRHISLTSDDGFETKIYTSSTEAVSVESQILRRTSGWTYPVYRSLRMSNTAIPTKGQDKGELLQDDYFCYFRKGDQVEGVRSELRETLLTLPLKLYSEYEGQSFKVAGEEQQLPSNQLLGLLSGRLDPKRPLEVDSVFKKVFLEPMAGPGVQQHVQSMEDRHPMGIVPVWVSIRGAKGFEQRAKVRVMVSVPGQPAGHRILLVATLDGVDQYSEFEFQLPMIEVKTSDVQPVLLIQTYDKEPVNFDIELSVGYPWDREQITVQNLYKKDEGEGLWGFEIHSYYF